MSGRRYRIVICRGPECGGQRGSEALHEVFRSAIEANNARSDHNEVELAWQSCFGRCTQGPNVLVRELVDVKAGMTSVGLATMPAPRGTTALYNRMAPSEPDRVTTVIVQHVQGGQIVREFIERVGPAGIGPIDPLASRAKDR